MRLKIVVGALLLLAVGTWLFWPKATEKSLPNQPEVVAETPNVEVKGGNTQESESDWIAPIISFDSYESEYGPLPASLEGTQIPFDLMVDENGNLIVNQSLRRFFDYFFTLDGEEPLERILARIKELITKHLPASAQQRALEILDQYVSLKKQELELAKQIDADFKASGERPGFADLKQEIRSLRASNLDAEVYDAFFGEEDGRDDYTMARLEIQRDTSLSDEERKEALKAIEQYLPENDRKYLEEEREIQNVYESVDFAKQQGASEAEIFHIRSQAFGAEAAERYAEADKELASWDARVATYREQRQQILDSEGLSESDKEAEIQALREQHFEGTELKRIPVIDSMKDAEQ
ncbi:MAG: hypothetical protein MI867_26685 [Pseudomonadales bacterium]|nr:hypothetical protein [Pseudomonadales bacterium]